MRVRSNLELRLVGRRLWRSRNAVLTPGAANPTRRMRMLLLPFAERQIAERFCVLYALSRLPPTFQFQ